MAKKVYQYRFGMDNDNITLNELITGITLPICQFSIETLPGTLFIINNTQIRIGATGIYEIMFDTISNVRITIDSANLMRDGIEYCDLKGIPNTKYKILINIVYTE